MSTWVVGDVQGCLRTLEALVATLGWRPGGEDLWLLGDLVNRGPRSLGVLRWAVDHDVGAVLGNHDLHLLARAAGVRPPGRQDTLDGILKATDRRRLLGWLRERPLLVERAGDTLVHAGLPPRWSLKKARRRAAEVEGLLRAGELDPLLPGPSRAANTVAGLTRMRFVDAEGHPTYDCNGPPSAAPPGQVPWFDYRPRTSRVVCGHWAALGLRARADLLALDTGCVWGHALTAACLETGEIVQQSFVD